MILLQQFVLILPQIVATAILAMLACGFIAVAVTFVFKLVSRIIYNINRYFDEK